MKNWIRRAWRKLFYKKPTPPRIIIEDQPSVPDIVPPSPTDGGTVSAGINEPDYVNDGDPSNPDHTFLFWNLKIDEERKGEVDWYCNKFIDLKPLYTTIRLSTGVPEWFLFILHIRECSLSTAKVLHNGELLSSVNKRGTRLVPRGRGKGKNWTFTTAAIDAMRYKKYDLISDWSLDNTLHLFEKWNGLGYRKRIGDRGVIEYSPFIVAGSNFHDETSKYVRDGVYDKYAKEKQLGSYTILKGLYLKGLVNL